MKTCCFCGHGKYFKESDIRDKFDKVIHELLADGYFTFYNGAYGGFDSFALRRIATLKTDYPQIENYVVSPYLNESYLSRFEYTVKEDTAKILYPFEDRVMPRFAILKRNEWMVDHSDIVVSYINYSWGGARKMYDYAKRKGKRIINLGTLVED